MSVRGFFDAFGTVSPVSSEAAVAPERFRVVGGMVDSGANPASRECHLYCWAHVFQGRIVVCGLSPSMGTSAKRPPPVAVNARASHLVFVFKSGVVAGDLA